MVAVLRKIIAAGTGQQAESRMPPLIEFYGPEMIEVGRVKITLNILLRRILPTVSISL